MELGPNQKKWVEALRSGEYEQTMAALVDHRGYCCLGVAAHLFAGEPTAHNAWLHAPGKVIKTWDSSIKEDGPQYLNCKWAQNTLGLYDGTGITATGNSCLADLNDGGNSFEEIADTLENEASSYFSYSV